MVSVGNTVLCGLHHFESGVTSRALRLEKQQVTKANKRQIPGLKMLTLLFFNKLGARSTGYAHR
jgi:hypothetical protein